MRDIPLRDEEFPLFLEERIIFLPDAAWVQDQIQQHRPSVTVKMNGVLVIPLPQNVLGFDTRHLFHGPVPGDKPPFDIDRIGRVRQKIDDVRQATLLLPQGFLRQFPIRYVTDGLDGADNLSLAVIQGARFHPERSLPLLLNRDLHLGYEKIFFFLLDPIAALNLKVRPEKPVDQHGSPYAVKGNSIFIIASAQHVFPPDPRHFFHGPVPGDDLFIKINHEGRVRQKIDDVRHPALRFPKRLFG